MIPFHRLLITTAILFCVILGVWLLVQFRGGGGVSNLVLGISFGAAAAALTYYLRHLDRFLHRRP